MRQSTLKSWSSCALKAKLSHLDGLPELQGSKAAFGTAIHAGLEYYGRTADVEMAIKLFLEQWDEAADTIDVWNKFTSFGGLRTRGIDIIRSYHDRIRLEDRVVIATEHRFLVPFGRHELEGTMDLLEVKRNHRGKDLLAISDFKTASKRPTVSALALDIQFSVYIWASLQREFWFGVPGETNNAGQSFPPIVNAEWWWENLKDMPRRGIWIALWDNGRELDAGARDDDDFGRLYRLIEEIERAIEHNVFVPSIGEACEYCPHSSGACPVVVPSRAEWENRGATDENAWLC